MFTDIEDFGRYVQGLEMSITLEALYPSITQAEDVFNKAVGAELLEELLQETKIAERVKSAIANYAMYRYLIFWSASKNNTSQSLYKYQYEAIRNEYISIFWSSMDAIFAWLDSEKPEKWTSSYNYKIREQLPVKSAVEFDRYFQIDKSSYFFSKIQFIMKKIMDDEILPRIQALSSPGEKIMEKVNRVLCYHTMAQAVMLFDVLELPPSIRVDIAHEYTKESSLIQAREKIKSILMSDVEKYYSDLEAEVKNIVNKEASLVVLGNMNEEENNFYATL